MKRDINCDPCAKAWPDRKGRDKNDEEVVKVRGVALRDFVCDSCAIPVLQGSLCTAVSVLGRGQVYYEWEHDYLQSVEQAAEELKYSKGGGDA